MCRDRRKNYPGEKQKIFKKAKRIVIKVGSAVLAKDGFTLNINSVLALAQEISVLWQNHYEIVLVSSGAILAGMEKLNLSARPQTIPQKQAIAAIGQSSLMKAYEESFARSGCKIAQILLTNDDICNRRRYLNARNTFTTLFRYGVIPIVNENDSVVTNEIKFGDNDRLSGLVAGLISADLLIILSHIEGLYTSDPTEDPEAQVIPFVENITRDVRDMNCSAKRKTSFIGTGGIQTKILAAQEAAKAGIATWLVNGKSPEVLSSLLHYSDGTKREVGTFFFPEKDKLNSRKTWIGYALRAKGKLMVDEGARHMLSVGKKSLLASGIIGVEGDFGVGDLVQCTDPGDHEFARGLVNYNADELRIIKGKKSSEIEQCLGYKYYDEIIHRDDLVIL